MLGGSFVSRLNMNLREDKHWAYGAGSGLSAAEGQGPFFVRAPVQTDKTSESIQEMVKELQGILGRLAADRRGDQVRARQPDAAAAGQQRDVGRSGGFVCRTS